ncbi:HD domain-containing phosphohydrolase [Vibrio chaetopteri]|uniref:HD domain-containing phosphohydrolase n=1 Tax=Vibrio chaetopteri TaxID=3016528 RepID=UPI003AB72234
MQRKQRKKISIRITVSGMFIIATFLTGSVAIFLQYHFAKELSKEHIFSRYNRTAATITEYINKLDYDASYTAKLFAKISEQHFEATNDIFPLAELFAEALRANNNLYSIYVANEKDEFFQLVNLDASILIRDKTDAIAQDRWAMVTHLYDEAGNRIKKSYFLNDDFTIRDTKVEPSNYYPTKRPWYKVQNNETPTKTEPYLFHNWQVTGQTYSLPIEGRKAVIGVDIVLSSLAANFSENIKVNNKDEAAEVYLYSENGEIVASNQILEAETIIPSSKPFALTDKQRQLIESTQPLKVSNENDWAPIDFTLAGEPKGYVIDLLDIIANDTGLEFEYINGRSWEELVSDYQNGSIDILHSIQKNSSTQDVGVFTEPLYQLPFSLVTQANTKTIEYFESLSGKKVGMLAGWSIIPDLNRAFPNVQIMTFPSLHLAFDALKNGDVDAVLESDAIVKHKAAQSFDYNLQVHPPLRDVNQQFSNQFYMVLKQADAALLPILNQAITNISTEQRTALSQKWLEAEFGKPSAAFSAMVPYKKLIQVADDKSELDKLIYAEIGGKPQYLFVTTVGSASGIQEYFAVVVSEEIVLNRVKDRVQTSIAITAGIMLLLLPLAWVFGSPIVRPINLLREETLKIQARQYDQLKLIDSPIKEIWDLSTAVHDLGFKIQAHEKTQQDLIEAIIKLIAEAIDDKSPYTAGHCNRVPELGIMLAEAVEACDNGKFKTFKFANDDERREFRIAAWLHDCGKITTPEHIIDKGSKLEANYNRIHEVRMRFEVLWRDAEIDMLKQLMQSPDDELQLRQKLAVLQQALKDDFEFIATANVGGEFMDDEKIERIKQIAEQTWTRQFDDRLGLSPQEELAITQPSTPVPTKEKLLQDRDDHITPRTGPREYDPALNINVKVPEHQYNLGEVYNLTIRRGTLTEEDRFKINEHTISGIKMLERLPFPSELSRVPRYASTHHETLKGTGYPRKLTGDDLSIPERILVIADIFEALTASDRPYKKAKPISVAVDIMYRMALDDHFDMDLFKLFLSSGIYLRYAETYLPESQIDEVELSKYIHQHS